MSISMAAFYIFTASENSTSHVLPKSEKCEREEKKRERERETSGPHRRVRTTSVYCLEVEEI